MAKEKVPLHRLSKDKLVYLATHNCEAHGHKFLEHYNCYLKENPDEQRVGFLDIEASHLTADIGILLTWSIKRANGKVLTGSITKADIDSAPRGREDAKVVRSLVEALNEFDVIVTYYGSKFDIPFMRTRAVMLGIPFPHYGTLKQIDAYYSVKFKFRLISNRLVRACKAILGKSDKTEIDWDIWRSGSRGDKKSLAYILDHNIHDVVDLEKLYNVVKPFTKGNQNAL